MPPRHAYWTILVDEQPTAFRAADRESLEPTFNRLHDKHPSARMVWFQNGKIWNSRLDAQEAMRARGDRGRAGDFRQRQTLSERPPARRNGSGESRGPDGKLEWKPKSDVAARPKLDWKPKSEVTSSPRAPRPSSPRAPRASSPQAPRPSSPRPAKPAGTLERRSKSWRPGGDHRDPRQKYKDAKKAKWTRFKQTVRKRWEAKNVRKKKDEE